MLNDNPMKSGYTACLSNVTALSSLSYEDDKKRKIIAADAAERFLQSSRVLSEGEYLGWQMEFGKDGSIRMYAFSSAGVHAAPEDFGWIFRDCAEIEETSQEALTDLLAGNGNVYTLQYKPEMRDDIGSIKWKASKNRDYLYDDEEDETDTEKYLREFLYELRRTISQMDHTAENLDVTICIVAGSGCGGSGMVLISLPCEMPLRLRTMLSLAFPDTVIMEMIPSEKSFRWVEWLPAAYVNESMEGLFAAVMQSRFESDTKDMEEDLLELDEKFFEDFLLQTPDEICDDTAIDELEFSLRTYNCLKRSGVHTVGQLRILSDEELQNIRNLGKKNIEEIRQVLTEHKITFQPEPVQTPAPDYVKMLQELIGLGNVKEQIRKITAFAKLKQEMEQLGNHPVPFMLNMEFTGNPGTAKTTVARILAGIFQELGLLTSNELVEVGRADLVARYEGQTADKVKSVFQKAKGKLLFIDEAYSLVEHYEGAFGDEAIHTIVQEMENNRADTIVIFAGYPDQMQEFFSRNPGLRSRVPFSIRFLDYSIEEMVQITEAEAKKRGFTISETGRKQTAHICRMAVQQPDAGNGRFCRNLVESAILSYAARVYGNGAEAADKDYVLSEKDFSAPGMLREKKKADPIGFKS